MIGPDALARAIEAREKAGGDRPELVAGLVGPGSGRHAVPKAATAAGTSGANKAAPAKSIEEDLAIAKVAMERGLVTLAEVRESLQAQADFAAIGRPLPLGQVLVKRRAMDVDTFIDISREARERSVRCGSCAVLSLVPRPEEIPAGAVEGRCPRCG